MKINIKRFVDSMVSFFGAILLSPLFLIIAILIKINSKGPVFFRQERIGKNGKTFKIWKFRSMVEGADKTEVSHFISKNDSKITKVGKFLREWTLDEWPQLINVLRGEMSLVGPRPLPVYQFSSMTNEQKKRFSVLPGMVSLVDIRGRNLVDWDERFELDSWYVQNRSLWLDFKILFLTPYIIISRRGVYGEGGTNKPFSKE